MSLDPDPHYDSALALIEREFHESLELDDFDAEPVPLRHGMTANERALYSRAEMDVLDELERFARDWRDRPLDAEARDRLLALEEEFRRLGDLDE